MSIAGWELDSFALLRLMDYMQMIHSLLLLFDPSTPAVWKSTRDIFGWRWFFIIIIIIVPTHARIICTQTYIHTRMQANSLVMVLCSRTCWKQPCQKTGCFFSFGWICLPNCMALKKILLLGEYQRESCQGQLLQFNLTSSGRRKWTNLLFFFSKCQFSHPKSFARQRAS